MALIVRVAVEAMGTVTIEWRQIVIFASLASIFFGSVAAVNQKSIKRLLAYSSINNIGFALVALAAGTPEDVSSVLDYMTVFILITLGRFMVVIRIDDEVGRHTETN